MSAKARAESRTERWGPHAFDTSPWDQGMELYAKTLMRDLPPDIGIDLITRDHTCSQRLASD